MKSFMIRFQQSIHLLNLCLLFRGFEVMLLEKASILCLKTFAALLKLES
jgi:hypothetical protein